MSEEFTNFTFSDEEVSEIEDERFALYQDLLCEKLRQKGLDPEDYLCAFKETVVMSAFVSRKTKIKEEILAQEKKIEDDNDDNA